MIRLKKLGHIQLRVADLERSKAFYRDVLGFRVAEQDAKHGDEEIGPGTDTRTLGDRNFQRHRAGFSGGVQRFRQTRAEP